MESMKKIKNVLVLAFFVLFLGTRSFAETAWVNDLKSLFESNGAIIYAINLRTFNSNDKNNNGIIEEDLGEERGTFINAIARLDELVQCGVNTIHLMPITPVGKVKALGTAGSLYAASSFNELNPQLKSPNSKLTIEDEFKKFVAECHNRHIRVIVDLPACGAYDLYLRKPELFKKDKNQNPVTPSDWTDVRLLEPGTNEKINTDVLNLYQGFIDMVVEANADGIVANVASIKPYAFWKKIIDEVHNQSPQFLFLAQAYNSPQESPSEYAPTTPYNKLLDAGFDGYYGNYSQLKNWKSANDLISQVQFDINLAKKYSKTKSVIGSFATQDQLSPILVNGPQYSKMIVWLNATLPLNSYYIDGFPTGDNYIYFWANKKAPKTFTDDDYYFVHRGQMDIFNFSKRPIGNQFDILQDYITANKFKTVVKTLVSDGAFIPLRTSSSSIFGYARSYKGSSIVVIGNLDFKKLQKATVYVSKVNPSELSVPIKISSIPKLLKGKIVTDLLPGEIQVLYFNKLDLK